MATATASRRKKAGSKERIDVRLRAEQKAYIEHAANIKGLTLTDFIVQNVVENAIRTIREYETWTLERPDAELFIETLMNPPAPGAQLTAAAKRYKDRVLHHSIGE
jgi:uncharacterized protein (DUF1778 family)